MNVFNQDVSLPWTFCLLPLQVQVKFRLDLSDEEAVHYMQSLIDESVSVCCRGRADTQVCPGVFVCVSQPKFIVYQNWDKYTDLSRSSVFIAFKNKFCFYNNDYLVWGTFTSLGVMGW